MDEIRDELSDLDKQLGNVTAWEEQRLAKIDELVKDDKLTPEQAEKLRENPELAHEEGPIRDALIDAGFIGGSREGWLSELLGGIGDELAFLFGGDASNVNGWIDENGEFEFNTCFVAGTLVRVAPATYAAIEIQGRYYKKIEEVVRGDVVLSWDERTGRLEWNRVLRTFVRSSDRIFTISYEDGMTVQATHDHPFWIAGKGWTQAERLTVGDRSQTSTGTNQIVGIEIGQGNETVYNFEVANAHSYHVTTSDLLVHNAPGDAYDRWVQQKIDSGQVRTAPKHAFPDAPDPDLLERNLVQQALHMADNGILDGDGDVAANTRMFLESVNVPEEEIEAALTEIERREFLHANNVPMELWDSIGAVYDFGDSFEFVSKDGVVLGGSAIDEVPSMVDYYLTVWGIGSALRTGFRLTTAGAARLFAGRQGIVPAIRTAGPSEFFKTHSIGGNASSDTVRKLAASMRQDGWIGDPIEVVIIHGRKYVLDGHHRVAAAARAKIDVHYKVLDEAEALTKYKYGSLDEILWHAVEAGPDKLR